MQSDADTPVVRREVRIRPGGLSTSRESRCALVFRFGGWPEQRGHRDGLATFFEKVAANR